MINLQPMDFVPLAEFGPTGFDAACNSDEMVERVARALTALPVGAGERSTEFR